MTRQKRYEKMNVITIETVKRYDDTIPFLAVKKVQVNLASRYQKVDTYYLLLL